jgi:hypothetical protein
MNYNFASLSHSEFEDLARDLVGREIELRFEAFSNGPDGGMDGRHARANGSPAPRRAPPTLLNPRR